MLKNATMKVVIVPSLSWRNDMGRSSASYGRGKPTLKPQPTVLVICEDTKSSKNYLNDAKVFYRVNADVEVLHAGKTNPLGIVNYALERQRHYNNVFCVIDRDTHEDFDQAMDLAQSSERLSMIVSYPCFEYWLLLHFKYSRKAYARTGKKSPGDQMLKALKECETMENYEKGGSIGLFDRLSGEPLAIAKKNAARSLAAAVAEKENNPSTTLHELLKAFEELAKPKRA